MPRRTGRTPLGLTPLHRRVLILGVSWIACVTLGNAGLACAGRYLPIGKPDRPPVAEEAVDATLLRLASSRCVDPADPEIPNLSDADEISIWLASAPPCLEDGDPLIRYLHAVQDYADYIEALRGEDPGAE